MGVLRVSVILVLKFEGSRMRKVEVVISMEREVAAGPRNRVKQGS